MLRVISLGLGVQSVALYYISSLGLLPRVDYAIVADPGKERSATYQYLQYLQTWKQANDGIDIIVNNDKNLYQDLLNNQNSRGDRFASIPAFIRNDQGELGMLHRQCTSEYKIKVIDRTIRDLYGLSAGKRRPRTDIWKGISVEELERMTNPREVWKVHVYPFTGYWFSRKDWGKLAWGKFSSRADLLSWYEAMGLPVPVKSACVFCPYRSDASWEDLRRNSPADFQAAVAIDQAIRDSSKKRIQKPCYLHRSLQPLDQVKFSGGDDLWKGECSGNCNI